MSQLPPDQVPPRPRRQPKKSAPGIATWAVVLGVVAVLTSPVFLVGLVAIVIGFLAVGKTGEPSGRPGRGMAIAGMAMGAASLLIGGVLILVVALPMMAAKKTADSATQLRGIHQGLVIFANSNKEKYPGLNADSAGVGNDNIFEDQGGADALMIHTGN